MRRIRWGLTGLGAYGVAMAAVGVLAAVGSASPASLAADGDPQRPSGRVLAQAPVLPPETGDGAGLGTATRAAPPARVGRTARGQVTPFRPTRLILPDGAGAAVDPAGVRGDGSLVVPEDPRRVGWWNGGAQADDPFGGVVIAGHVDSRAFGVGVLARLKTVRTGDVVRLTAGRHSASYRVTSIRQVRQARLAADTDVFRQDVAPRLVLITCGGAFDPVRHRYTDNLVILADPVP